MRSGAGPIVSVVTRSGTNQLHGAAGTIYQNENWNGNNAPGGTSAGFEIVQPDASLGGPLLRDRAWFFGAYRYTNNSLGVSRTPAQLANLQALVPGFEPLTMEDVLLETAITYGETYTQKMTGSQIKDVLEDVCDNLFNPDPYYQQGGDMVRVGGLSYMCAPAENAGRRISDLTLDNGKRLEASKSYKVAGWASVNPQQGKPVWDVFANHLRSGTMPVSRSNVTLKGVDGNPGIAE